MENKLIPAVLLTYYLSQEIKKDTRISWDYPLKNSNGAEMCAILYTKFEYEIFESGHYEKFWVVSLWFSNYSIYDQKNYF
jgi:hypothetical protein